MIVQLSQRSRVTARCHLLSHVCYVPEEAGRAGVYGHIVSVSSQPHGLFYLSLR